MWQNLLKERFGMMLHHESREFQVDELTIAKGGLKMKETESGDPIAALDDIGEGNRLTVYDYQLNLGVRHA
jgi:uncharacterized protein (TIGR03435 family)